MRPVDTHRELTRSLMFLWAFAAGLFVLMVLLPWWALALVLGWLVVAWWAVLLVQGGAAWDREAADRVRRWVRVEGE